jgi:hypothetical protein
MASKAHQSKTPGAKIVDAQASIARHVGRGDAAVTTPQPGVGRPPAAIGGPKVANTRPDYRDNDGDGTTAGSGPSAQAMLGRGGAC